MSADARQNATPFSRPIAAKELATIRRPKSYASKSTPAEREAIRAALDLARVTAFHFEAALTPKAGADWRLEGRIFARVAQRCVVTLEPVPEEIDAPFVRLWSNDAPEEAAMLGDGASARAGAAPSGELDDAEDDLTATELDLDDLAVEQTPDPVDLGEVAIETLRLSLDPYPRVAGAAFDSLTAGPPGAEPLTDEAARPFAGLAALKARLGGESDESSDDDTPDDDKNQN
ncbi:MAG: DUF177 domain-containing protein [Neomegalonema sp.]|nr:DUF177 domain-containing protein [Neomegalonema sp.]